MVPSYDQQSKKLTIEKAMTVWAVFGGIFFLDVWGYFGVLGGILGGLGGGQQIRTLYGKIVKT